MNEIIRTDFWNWAVRAFGKGRLKQFLSTHPLKDGIFLNQEEKSYIYKI